MDHCKNCILYVICKQRYKSLPKMHSIERLRVTMQDCPQLLETLFSTSNVFEDSILLRNPFDTKHAYLIRKTDYYMEFYNNKG